MMQMTADFSSETMKKEILKKRTVSNIHQKYPSEKKIQ
jgi:hypothetical protein